MRIFSFHLLATRPAVTLGALMRSPSAAQVPGLRHMECLAAMTLASPILSTERFQTHRLAVFADWENEVFLERFLTESTLGNRLSTGWHVRLRFLRHWQIDWPGKNPPHLRPTPENFS